MGTKNNPGKFDCYANADPDEPMFILLGRDPMAPLLVAMWVKMRELRGTTSADKLAEADECGSQMALWAARLGRANEVLASTEIFEKACAHYIGATATIADEVAAEGG
jgi:hypothetical protein